MSESSKSHRVAIMQPYTFPYIGYYQLLAAVDTFVIYDDVQFIKGGWINRNYILSSGKPGLFTIPLQNASPNKRICETMLNAHDYARFTTKFQKTLEQNYARAPFYGEIIELIRSILDPASTTIAEVAANSLRYVASFLDLPVNFLFSSATFRNQHLSGQNRVLDICAILGATEYINAPGGRSLYSKEDFQARNIKLLFADPLPLQYKQFNHPFVPNLSIIDVLMFNGREGTLSLLQQRQLT